MIDELKKLRTIKKSTWCKSPSNNAPPRNIDKIFNTLISIKGFQKFVKFNGIDDESVKYAAINFEHRFIPKKETVYNQGDRSSYFYGIIQGKIGTFKKNVVQVLDTTSKPKFAYLSKLNINKKEKPVFKDEVRLEQVNSKSSGECFGYDGLMNKAHRTSTTMTIEDTDFFVLSEEYFDKCFNKAIRQAERERKDFLIERIPAFKNDQVLFNQRFKYIKTHNKTFNDILYTEGSKATSIWIVYLGECNLLKNFRKLKSGEKINNCKQTITLNITKGGFSSFQLSKVL